MTGAAVAAAGAGAILVLNSGSSSIKYRLVEPPPPEAGTADTAGPAAGAHGIVERIGEPGHVSDHHAALAQIFADLALAPERVRAVGHRVVHGGREFTRPTVVDDRVLAAIRALEPLAPLHNPGAVAGIEAARRVVPAAPHVAVFDTAFHAGLPAVAATYAIDSRIAAELDIRRYGFHGISHRYVAARTAGLLGRPFAELNMIVLHLGNGASATAIHSGRSVETSMGFTPLEGLVMGTRCGDLDPALPVFFQRAGGMSADAVDDLLQHHSGLAGLCGENDVRTILARRAEGDAPAALAIDVYCHRIRKYVGAYHAVLGRLDAIAFTAGVGEHAAEIRAESLAGLQGWGIAIDPDRNTRGPATRVISPDGGRVRVCVVPTDEERAIAEEVDLLLRAAGTAPAPA